MIQTTNQTRENVGRQMRGTAGFALKGHRLEDVFDAGRVLEVAGGPLEGGDRVVGADGGLHFRKD